MEVMAEVLIMESIADIMKTSLLVVTITSTLNLVL